MKRMYRKYGRKIAERTYKFAPKAIPWEKEAMWAGKTEGMTQKALQACAAGEMWKVYKPTPKTAEWLREKGVYKMIGKIAGVIALAWVILLLIREKTL